MKLDLGRVQGEAGSWSVGEEGDGCCSRDKSFEKKQDMHGRWLYRCHGLGQAISMMMFVTSLF